MSQRASMGLSRSFIVVAALSGFTGGCFALFSLDDYGPPSASADASVATDSAPANDGAATDAARGPRIVFVTSERYTGSMGGLDGADNRCSALATDAGLGGKWAAWLGEGQVGPAGRVGDPSRAIVLANGANVARSLDDLADAGPRTPIVVTEKKTTLANVGCDTTHVWTNATPDGGVPVDSEDCSSWSSVLSAGVAGKLGTGGADWTTGCNSRACQSTGHLYCFQK